MKKEEELLAKIVAKSTKKDTIIDIEGAPAEVCDTLSHIVASVVKNSVDLFDRVKDEEEESRDEFIAKVFSAIMARAVEIFAEEELGDDDE